MATSTSRFGVGKRESHDASRFYQRFGPVLISDDEIVVPCPLVDSVIAADARDMAELPGGCVALVVTSPPYFSGKEYEAATGVGGVPATYIEYLAMLRD